jgi:hypothetical protein
MIHPTLSWDERYHPKSMTRLRRIIVPVLALDGNHGLTGSTIRLSHTRYSTSPAFQTRLALYYDDLSRHAIKSPLRVGVLEAWRRRQNGSLGKYLCPSMVLGGEQ